MLPISDPSDHLSMLSEWQLRVEIHNPAMNAQCARWVMWTSSLHTLSFAGAVATPTWKASSVLQSHPTFAGCALGFPVLLPGEFAACFSVFVLRTSQYLQRLTSPLAQCQPVKINKTKKDPEVPCSTFTPTKHCPTSPNYFPRCIHIPRSNWHCETGSSDMFI